MGEKLYGKEVNFVNGSSSTGIYSLDIDPSSRFGIAVGGDYTQQEANINNIATTINGGESWQIQASGKMQDIPPVLKSNRARKERRLLL